MNIVYYCGAFPKLSESFVLNEIAELDRQGHNVAVFAVNNPAEEFQHEELDEMDVEIFYADSISPSNTLSLLSPGFLESDLIRELMPFSKPLVSMYELHLAQEFDKFLENLDFEVDHVHGHFASLDKLGALYTVKKRDLSFSVSVHAIDIFTQENFDTAETVLKSSDRIIAASEYNKNYVKENYSTDKPIDVVYATNKLDKFSNTEKETVEGRILTVGRLVEKKGIEYGLEGFAEAYKKNQNLEYHIVSSGPLEEKLKQKAEDLGIGDQVKFLGKVSDERLISEYAEADIFLLPCIIAEDGDRDAMPVVLKEGMAARTACISTTVSAIPELIDDGEDGYLVPPKNSDQIAERISKLVNDRELRGRIASAGFEKVQGFKIENEVEKLLSSFEKC